MLEIHPAGRIWHRGNQLNLKVNDGSTVVMGSRNSIVGDLSDFECPEMGGAVPQTGSNMIKLGQIDSNRRFVKGTW